MQSTTGDVEDDEEEDEDETLVHGRRKRKVAFMPSLGKCSVLVLCRPESNAPYRYYPYYLLPRALVEGVYTRLYQTA
jgi:hypothetical protein